MATPTDTSESLDVLTPERLLSLRRITGFDNHIIPTPSPLLDRLGPAFRGHRERDTKTGDSTDSGTVFCVREFNGVSTTMSLHMVRSSLTKDGASFDTSSYPSPLVWEGALGQQLTFPTPGTADTDPVLADDGSTVFFLSSRKDGKGLWAVSLSGGEPYLVAEFPVAISNLMAVRTNATARKSGAVKQVLAFSAEVYVQPASEGVAGRSFSLKETATRDETPPDSTAMVFDSLPVRHWDTWNAYAKRSHVFCIALAPYSGSTPVHRWIAGDYIDLMPGIDSDCPGKPFGGATDSIAFDGDEGVAALVYRPPEDGKGMMWSTGTAVFLTHVPIQELLDSTSHRHAHTGTSYAMAGDPSYSVMPLEACADGTKVVSSKYATFLSGAAGPKRISTLKTTHAWPRFWSGGVTYLRMTRPGYEADAMKPVLWTLTDGNERALCNEHDISFSSLEVVQSSTTAVPGQLLQLCGIVSQAAAAHIGLLSVSAETTDASTFRRTHLPSGSVHTFTISGVHDGSIVCTALISSLIRPADLYELRLPLQYTPHGEGEADNGSEDKKNTVWRPSSIMALSSANADQLRTLSIPQPQTLSVPGSNGEPVHAFLLPPAQLSLGAPPDARYPLAVLIHGGPQGVFGDDWHYRWNPQIYAAAGMYVLTINFHGSTSFGQAVTDSIRCNWGGTPYEDIMNGVEYVCSTVSSIDPARVCALGASFGGYMINWINGHAGKRFKAMVYHCGIFDTRSFYYSTEELWFPEWDFGGSPLTAEGRKMYDKWNPSLFVDKWETPTLVIQGGKDFRCVESEGIATFTALQRQGIPSRFVYFPDEGHFVAKGKNSLRWHREVLRWLEEMV